MAFCPATVDGAHAIYCIYHTVYFIYCMCVLACILSHNCHRLISVSCKPALSAIIIIIIIIIIMWNRLLY